VLQNSIRLQNGKCCGTASARKVLRAEACMLDGESGRAVEQWRTILQNPGIAQLSATVPIARLQLARSYAASSRGGPPDSRTGEAYQEFLRRRRVLCAASPTVTIR
jgi:hypothetical protein